MQLYRVYLYWGPNDSGHPTKCLGGGWGVDKSLEGEYENELKIAKYGNE